MKIVNIRENPQYRARAIKYFQEKWANKDSMMVYEDCISRSTNTESPIPIWYLLMDIDEIVGCCGLITNDFISCMDLCPWLCALYVEASHRGKTLGKMLIDQAKQDAAKAGFAKLHLCTDHIGYYEKYGFTYIGTGYHPWGGSSRVYEICIK